MAQGCPGVCRAKGVVPVFGDTGVVHIDFGRLAGLQTLAPLWETLLTQGTVQAAAAHLPLWVALTGAPS